MKTNKILISTGLSLIALSLVGCGMVLENTSVNTHTQTRSVSRTIRADYGMHVQDRVTILFGTAKIPFKFSDFGINNLVVGDEIKINFTGEYIEYETYPSTIDTKNMHITSVELFEARLVEYEISETKALEPTADFKGWTMINAEYVINEDGSFLTKEKFLETAEAGTKVYGSNPAIFDSLNVTTLFSYNPRP